MSWLLLGFAGLCLVLAVILPGMPTTVFLLMAAWAAARSSPRLHAWLLNHGLFGPMLRGWDNGRSVSRRAKWSAAACIGCMAVVLTWLWRRPEPQG